MVRDQWVAVRLGKLGKSWVNDNYRELATPYGRFDLGFLGNPNYGYL